MRGQGKVLKVLVDVLAKLAYLDFIVTAVEHQVVVLVKARVARRIHHALRNNKSKINK